MSKSLFWQEGFPKERRVELVAQLLYAGDPNARIPNDEGLRPDRVNDFYAAVGFSSRGDFDDRIDAIEQKYRYEGLVTEEAAPSVEPPVAPYASPSADPFSTFFATEKPSASEAEVPVVVAPENTVRRVRKPRVTVSEQSMRSAPTQRVAPVVESPIVESVPALPTPDVPLPLASGGVRLPAPVLHAEDRVSAFARGVRSWFGRNPEAAEVAASNVGEGDVAERVDATVARLVEQECGAPKFGTDRESKLRANMGALDRLDRAIATSGRLDAQMRKVMTDRAMTLRSSYRDRAAEVLHAQREEFSAGISDAAARSAAEQGDSALRALAFRDGTLASDLAQFREQAEYVALQRGGAEAIAAIDGAFQDAWREAWKGDVTPVDIGPLEESLPRLRLLEGGSHSGVARLVAEARASVQREIDQRLPVIERAIKRAA